MSRIRSKETKPELTLRKALWKQGVRGYRKYPLLPGKPDLLFPRVKLVVFVDGCFWHGCPIHYRSPKSNTDYWLPKIARNIARDQEQVEQLRCQGYVIIRIWEHDVLPDPTRAVDEIITLLHALKTALMT